MTKKKKTVNSHQVEALKQISQAITSDLYVEDILKLIVTVTAQVMKSKICSLMLVDNKKMNLLLKQHKALVKRT